MGVDSRVVQAASLRCESQDEQLDPVLQEKGDRVTDPEALLAKEVCCAVRAFLEFRERDGLAGRLDDERGALRPVRGKTASVTSLT